MDAGIMSSIQIRRDTIFNYYDIKGDAEVKVEDFFSRLEQFASTCADQADFEQKFNNSELNKEYMNLFTELSSCVKLPDGAPTMKQFVKSTTLGMVESVVTHHAETSMKSAVINNVPDEVSDWMIYKENNIPGVAEIKTVDNISEATGIKRLFKRKK